MIEYGILLLYNKEIHLFKKHMATLISVSDIIHAKSVDIRQTHTWKAVVYNVDFLYCPTYMFWHPWLPIDNKQIQPRYLKHCQINSKKRMQTNYQITVFMLFQFFIFTHFTVISDSVKISPWKPSAASERVWWLWPQMDTTGQISLRTLRVSNIFHTLQALQKWIIS